MELQQSSIKFHMKLIHFQRHEEILTIIMRMYV